MPVIEGPTGKFMLQQMASVAELEAGMIGQRTKVALQAAKARGKRLGGYRGRGAPNDVVRLAAAEAVKAKTQARAADLAPTIAEIRAKGVTTLGGIAAALTERAIPTARGGEIWSETQVSRVLARM